MWIIVANAEGAGRVYRENDEREKVISINIQHKGIKMESKLHIAGMKFFFWILWIFYLWKLLVWLLVAWSAVLMLRDVDAMMRQERTEKFKQLDSERYSLSITKWLKRQESSLENLIDKRYSDRVDLSQVKASNHLTPTYTHIALELPLMRSGKFCHLV